MPVSTAIVSVTMLSEQYDTNYVFCKKEKGSIEILIYSTLHDNKS